MISALVLSLGIWATQSKVPQAQTSLIPSESTIVAGKTFKVALRMRMADGWHSYYSNPGESGMATSIIWKLPPGFKAGPIQWPVPDRIVVGGVAGFVYEKEAYLVTDITAPAALKPGSTVKIGAKVSWLLCSSACFPQHATLGLSVHSGSKTVRNPEYAAARAHLPTNPSPSGVRATLAGKSVVLSVPTTKPARGVQFFPADAAFFGADEPQVTYHAGIKLSIPMSRYASAPPKRLVGILVVPSSAGNGASWIDVQVTKP